ncbi:class I SAM-dependent methyltransferase [Desulfoferrobacter suflitae]|uniref:class I SAM-dependent methyltransferase n=1 Tax=Desulfoferrobacter suflitae TaxID=2865782 RepID=UPI002164AC8B|nr:class I SAM-dependent methyltransferase [Desulfoferrobacter suflitae]MCK8604360.1 class I SAM-dependent methyltransferase [Desulfoferrobacter suflitae]
MNPKVSSCHQGTDLPQCLFCKSSAIQPLEIEGANKPGQPYFICKLCGLIFVEFEIDKAFEHSLTNDVVRQPPSSHNLDEFGEKFGSVKYFNFYAGMNQELGETVIAQSVVDAIKMYHLNGSKNKNISILEVGCATGWLLSRLQRTFPNAQMMGLEPNPHSCYTAWSKFGVEVRNGTVQSYLPVHGECFDVVVMMGNLQLHPDPFCTLSLLAKSLCPGGLIIFETKNPHSSPRLLANLVARIPWISRTTFARKIQRQSYNGLRVGIPMSVITRHVKYLDLELCKLETTGPRSLRFQSKKMNGRTFRIMWKVADAIDCIRGQRAWTFVVARATRCRK